MNLKHVARHKWKYNNGVQETNHDQRQESTFTDSSNGDVGPEKTKLEVIHELILKESNKSAGPDEIPSDLLKLVNKKNTDILVDLFNTIYTTGVIQTQRVKK